MTGSETDVPDSVTRRGVKQVLRAFADSDWTGMTLVVDGMRITVGKNGPPSAVVQSSAPAAPGAAADGPAAPGTPAAVGTSAAPGSAATTSGFAASPGRAASGADLPGTAASAATSPGSAAATPPTSAQPASVDITGCVAVHSPAVGAFWGAPSPGRPPFVQVGQLVAEREQLAIVEVMKLMNPVVAPQAGEVVQVCAQNADMVEYEQVLFWIRPTDG